MRTLLATGLAALACALPSTTAWAAPATPTTPGPASPAGTTSPGATTSPATGSHQQTTTAAQATPTTVGYDVSHPQCYAPLPPDRAFGIVGVNGGLATTANPCLDEQLTWAWGSSGAVAAQPPAQLYLNTANPGELRDVVTTWPTTGATPYGSCTGGNTTACSWEYGWERAINSVTSIFQPAAEAAGVSSAPGRYTWWLDVETVNTWQSGSSAALARNRAALEGMAAYIATRGGRVGIYSTGSQFRQIAGSVGRSSTLYRLGSWLAGATSLAGAKSNCRKAPLTAGGSVVLAQYVVDGLDRDRSCH